MARRKSSAKGPEDEPISEFGAKTLAHKTIRGTDIKDMKDLIHLRKAKENLLNEANRISAEHPGPRTYRLENPVEKAKFFKKPVLAYGGGHNMEEHGEGKPYNEEEHLKKVDKDRRDNPRDYGDED
jgi:hypothetical protein